MSASTVTSKTRIFRSKSFWLISLFVIYNIFGWFVVPKIVESQLKTNLKTLAGWQTDVDKIAFNPYALSLRLTNADIRENTKLTVISFDELFIDFSLLGSLTGTLVFDDISLIKPFIHLDIDQQGTTNFQRAFASNTSTEQPEADLKDEDSGIIALLFDAVTISDGEIHLSDSSQGETNNINLEPISLSLEGFSTINNEGGDYALSIALKDEQLIKWQGQIGIAPLQSTGHLELHKIASTTFWHYVKSASPYWLKTAKVSVSGDYSTALLTEGTQFSIENTEVIITDLIMSESQESEPLLELNSLKVAPISFDLSELSLDLGHIELDQLGLAIERAQDQSLNILRPLRPQELESDAKPAVNEASAKPAAKTEEQAFRWQIADIKLNQGHLLWKDLALAEPANLKLNEMSLNIGPLSDDLSQAFPYDFSFYVQENAENAEQESSKQASSKKQHISGLLSAQPFVLNGKADITNIDLSLIQTYLNETTNLAIKEGRLSVSSDYKLALSTQSSGSDQLSGKVVSLLTIDDLALTDQVLNKPLSGFAQLAIGPVSVELPEDSSALLKVDIESILLDQPYGEILIDEEGQMNLSHLAKSSSNEEVESKQKAVAEAPENISEEETDTLALLLKLFEIKQGQFTYTDASLEPAFSTRITDLSGSIKDISSNTETKSSVSLTGNIDSQGKLKISGTLNPLSKQPYTDLSVQVNNVNLSMASPYSAKYAGYLIDKGKLDLDLNYEIIDNKLKAKNQILLNQFKFGKSVDSQDATNLPLPLAIGMLKDRNDVIDIDLPISGDLNDPSFRLSSVIINTFMNLITKVVTSPFSILGSIIEGGDDISEVEFAAGTSSLADKQKENIMTLAKALHKRPSLTLEIRGTANALLDQQNDLPITEQALIQLAKDRAAQISKVVIEEGNIDASRVFILEPDIIPIDSAKKAAAKTDANETAPSDTPEMIPSKFTLGVR